MGQVVFNKKAGWGDRKVTVPCGQCSGCRLETSRQWAMRIMHESSLYEANCFLTLTYSDENLPEHSSLVLRHHQLFMKRLKKRYGGKSIRFYQCGEYGENTHRPHYHSIQFNHDYEDKQFLKMSETGHPIFTSEKLDEIWGHGDCYIGSVTFESAAYCGRYVMTKLTGRRKEEYGSREPEQATQSRRPGIGAPWYKKWNTDVFPNDHCVMNGKKVRVPKYYDGLAVKTEVKLGAWKTDPRDGFRYFMPSLGFNPSELRKAKRKRNASKRSEDNTPQRLAIREEVLQLRLNRLIRKD